MRPYSLNSPHAAARLLAMALVADGNYSFTELRALDRLKASGQLGLSPEALKDVIEGFCEDLLAAAGGTWTGSACMDEAAREQLLAEVRDPELRARVVRLCQAIVQADGHEADGEAALLDAFTRAWRQRPPATHRATGARP
jgi:uncharacterized tellurite resistance protein B-like protein